jgi:hypothetical protein
MLLHFLNTAHTSVQTYHTKLEQLMTLTNKLKGLTRTLGSDFFLQDIIETEFASGENPSDPDANRDVTPERFSKLEKELVRGKGEVVSIYIPYLLAVEFTHVAGRVNG